MNKGKFKVAVIGAGVTGAATAYVLARYTSVSSVALIEMGSNVGAVNTDPRNNSQTLHDGSIETNYTPDKARKVFAATNVLAKYLHDWAPKGSFSIGSKMVIGVGNQEVAELRTRFEETKGIYPDLEFLERDQIWRREPYVMEGRPLDEPIVAIAHEGYTIDFRKLSDSFVEQAVKTRKLSKFMNTKIVSVSGKRADGYILTDQNGDTFSAEAIVFATGPHSLLFAKEMGYAQHLGLLPVAGSFFSAPKKNFLNGKVYTVQKPKLPFAAVHGDPEIFDPSTTRFGPTAKVLPMLIRHRYNTVIDFFKTSVPNWDGIKTLAGILADGIMFKYMAKNLLYDLPVMGKWFFLQDARKIVPKLKYSDLVYNTGFGGVRPQIVNTETHTLEMGDAQVLGDNVIFNVTPSPGASVCLANAYKDARQVCDFFGSDVKFYKERWQEDFVGQPEPVELAH